MGPSSWRPLAQGRVLRERARISAAVREFFAAREVLEVDVPVLGDCSVTDPYIDALRLSEPELWLQTSPEYYMKRLLAADSGSIYYFGKAFRADEQGRLHHREFTMLEWYRTGFDDRDLMDELCALISALDNTLHQQRCTYADTFRAALGVNPHSCSDRDLAELAAERCGVSWRDEPRATWLNLLFSQCVEPSLPPGLCIVYDYPECLSALARTACNAEGELCARRFEAFINGCELANGYYELTDAQEQRERFAKDNCERARLGKPRIQADPQLLAALESGIPDCAGVALGFDRLIKALLDLSSIAEQRSF